MKNPSHWHSGSASRLSAVKHFKLPQHLKLLKEMRDNAVVVVCILAQIGCTQEEVWQDWHSSQIGLVVMSEVRPHTDLFQAAWLVPKHASVRCGIGIVKNELAMFKQAMLWYPNAKWLYLVSGDSVPTKPTSVFCNPPVEGSITGARPFGRTHPNWYYGSQWMLLDRRDVGRILESWPQHEHFFTDTHKEWLCKHNFSGDGPDEQYLQTLLHYFLKVSICHPGVTIMEEEVEVMPAACGCHRQDQHAVLHTEEGPHLEQCLKSAVGDPLTFAFRKVAASVSADFLRQCLWPGSATPTGASVRE